MRHSGVILAGVNPFWDTDPERYSDENADHPFKQLWDKEHPALAEVSGRGDDLQRLWALSEGEERLEANEAKPVATSVGGEHASN